MSKRYKTGRKHYIKILAVKYAIQDRLAFIHAMKSGDSEEDIKAIQEAEDLIDDFKRLYKHPI